MMNTWDARVGGSSAPAWPGAAPDEILPGLFQGGTPDSELLGCPPDAGRYRPGYPFDVVVTLYADAQPAPWGVEEMRYGFADSTLSRAAADTAVALALVAHQRWRGGRRVLVRCQAGVNRSGLVTALILMAHGLEPQEAIALIRQRRSPAVLSNRHFEQWLMSEAPAALAALSTSADVSAA